MKRIIGVFKALRVCHRYQWKHIVTHYHQDKRYWAYYHDPEYLKYVEARDKIPLWLFNACQKLKFIK